MEKTPDIILFYYFIIAIFVFMIALMIAGIYIINRRKKQNDSKLLRLGKLFIGLCSISVIPLLLIGGYILYLYIG